MSEFISVIKTLVITAALIIGLQYEVDGMTLEKRGYQFLSQSAFISHVQGIARGAIKVSIEGYHWTRDFVGTKYNELKSNLKK